MTEKYYKINVCRRNFNKWINKNIIKQKQNIRTKTNREKTFTCKHLNKDLNHKIYFFIMIYFGKKWGHFGKKYGRNDFGHYYQTLLIKKLLK